MKGTPQNLKPEFITLLIGVNDWIREGISSSKFKIRIKKLIHGIQSNLPPPRKFLLITIPDFSCSPQKRKWGYGKSATNGITRLNKILKTEAALRDLLIVDIYPLSQNLCSQETDNRCLGNSKLSGCRILSKNVPSS